MTDRDSEIHNWRVLMVQQATFWRRDNKTRNFAFTLLEWAGNARRRALESDGVPDRGDAGSARRDLMLRSTNATDARG